MNYGPYPAIVMDWHDGDTCHIQLDLGFGILFGRGLDGKPTTNCRIFGINAPELATMAGKAALVGAQGICPAGTQVTVLSHGWDKFGGRFDGSITLSDGSDFGTRMIVAGFAVPYA